MNEVRLKLIQTLPDNRPGEGNARFWSKVKAN
jgi:hypothetical protein